MGNRDQKIKDELAALTLRQVRDEAWQWLKIMQERPPKGWETAITKQAQLLSELEPTVRHALSKEDSGTKTREYYRAKATLSGYCEKVRRRHGGKAPWQIAGKPVR